MLLIKLIDFVFETYSFILLARVIASWVQPPTDHEFMRNIMRFVYQVTEPVLAPIRALIPLPGIDLSPIVAFILLEIIRSGLINILITLL